MLEASTGWWVKSGASLAGTEREERNWPTMWMDNARVHEVVDLADGGDAAPSANEAEAKFQEDLRRCMLESKIASISSIMESKRLFICSDEEGKKQLDQVCDDVSHICLVLFDDSPTHCELRTLTN